MESISRRLIKALSKRARSRKSIYGIHSELYLQGIGGNFYITAAASANLQSICIKAEKRKNSGQCVCSGRI
jgi:hypothetical protein